MRLPRWVRSGLPIIAVASIAGWAYLRGEGAGSVAGESPDFTLPLVSGGNLVLSAHNGKVRVLDFWATWCGPCKIMMPQLANLHERYRDHGVLVVGIALDEPNAVRNYVRDHDITYPIVLGDQDTALRFGGVRGIPTTFVLDKQGKITNRHVGFRPVQILESDVTSLL